MRRKIKQMPNTGICVSSSANVGLRSRVQFLVWLIQFCEILVEKRNGFNPFEVVCDVVLLVRGMQVVAIQPKTHQYGFQSEFIFKQRDDGDASAAPGGDGFLTEGFFDGFFCRAVRRAIGGCYRGLSAVVRGDFNRDEIWQLS